MPKVDGLTTKQQRFVEEYTVDFNATQAAIRAGYSENSAGTIGWENMQKPEIVEAVRKRVEQLAMGPDEALIRLGKMARGSLEHFHRLTADGDITVDLSTKEAQDHLDLLTELEVRTVKKQNENGSLSMRQTARVKLHDAKDALKQVLRVHGLDKTSVDLRTPDGIQVEDARGKLEKQLEGMGGRLAALASANGANGAQPNGNGAKGE